jgi:hypothetical protein
MSRVNGRTQSNIGDHETDLYPLNATAPTSHFSSNVKNWHITCRTGRGGLVNEQGRAARSPPADGRAHRPSQVKGGCPGRIVATGPRQRVPPARNVGAVPVVSATSACPGTVRGPVRPSDRSRNARRGVGLPRGRTPRSVPSPACAPCSAVTTPVRAQRVGDGCPLSTGVGPWRATR